MSIIEWILTYNKYDVWKPLSHNSRHHASCGEFHLNECTISLTRLDRRRRSPQKDLQRVSEQTCETNSQIMQIEWIIVLTSLIAAASAGWRLQTVDDLLRNRNKCIKILNMQDDLQEEYGLFDFPDQDSAKCVIKCIMNRMGLFNDKRGPHVGRLVRQMKFASVSSTKEIRGEILNCAYQDMEMDPEDVCERAYALYQCIQNSNLLLMKSPGSINT
ncbi:hypothetical protein RP20_CCG013211 [Aedes albopictus]|nr:hypothetical protein RP20_CCG013211 [Aedes albopictus]